MKNKMSLLITALICFSFFAVTGCEDENAKARIDAEMKKADQKIVALQEAEAPKWAPASYQETSSKYDDVKELVNGQKYVKAKTGLDKFYQLADKTMAETLAAKTRFNNAQAKKAMIKYHVVKKGDWLCKMARRYYNDRYKWRQIYNANKDKIKDPNLIYPGQKFLIP